MQGSKTEFVPVTSVGELDGQRFVAVALEVKLSVLVCTWLKSIEWSFHHEIGTRLLFCFALSVRHQSLPQGMHTMTIHAPCAAFCYVHVGHCSRVILFSVRLPGVSIGPQGGVLAAADASPEGRISIWSTDTWERQQTLTAGSTVTGLSLSSSHLAVGTGESMSKINV